MDIDGLRARLSEAPALAARGRVLGVTGLSLRVALPGARIGDILSVERRNGPLLCEVVGFREGEAIAMALGDLQGVGPDDPVESSGGPFHVSASPDLLGRVVDGLGAPLDGGPELTGALVPVDRPPPSAMARRRVTVPIATGIRAIDGLLTLGEGQRVGVFAGSGVGKSSLLGAVARGCDADVVVVALVGERGREVGEFLDHSLGARGRKKSVVVVATSDVSPLLRLRAAGVATAYAEYFRDQGARVMLMVDSVTRVARAQREIGLAAGEPPARRGYPPSVFGMLPRLLERSGQGENGSITAIYTVLVEGGDMDEPIADEVRGVLDGHIVLDRALAARGRYPSIDVTTSLSRVMDTIVSKEHREAARRLRQLVGLYEQKRDLLTLGAYAKGSDPALDAAIARMPTIERFLAQELDETSALDVTLRELAGSVR